MPGDDPEGLAALRARYKDRLPSPEERARLEADPREGARALLRSLDARARRAEAWSARRTRLDSMRAELAAKGYRAVAGIDEAGRGPLAGPVFAACVVLGPDWDLPGLDDSKKLSPKAREALAPRIEAQALGFAVATRDAARIDTVNILEATREAMLEAVSRCTPVAPDFLLVDAVDLSRAGLPCRAIIEGDSKVAAIAAASILAKTRRDRFMEELDREYPGYGFAEHKGYGTESHLAALAELGPSPVHRKSFAPVAAWVLPTRDELARRLALAKSPERLHEVGLAVRAADGDLTPGELEDLRSLYRQRQRELGARP